MSDAIHNPAHYTAYPVQPIEISSHLGFCLGNVIKYVLRAPYKGGVEDCRKALKYLSWERELPQAPICCPPYLSVNTACTALISHLRAWSGAPAWELIMSLQADILEALDGYLRSMPDQDEHLDNLEWLVSNLADAIRVEQEEIKALGELDEVPA